MGLVPLLVLLEGMWSKALLLRTMGESCDE